MTKKHDKVNFRHLGNCSIWFVKVESSGKYGLMPEKRYNDSKKSGLSAGFLL